MFEEHERQESVRTVSPGALPLPARAAHAAPPARPPRHPALYSQVNRERQVTKLALLRVDLLLTVHLTRLMF